jgi:hypothetical protein
MGMPTHEDAKLLIELFKLRNDAGMQEAERWFLREFKPGPWPEVDQRYPPGSPERMHLNRVMSYWEMLGALVYHNLINADLLFDLLESTDQLWERIQDWLPAARAQMAVDVGENIELLVRRQHRWREIYQPKAERL